MNTAATAGRISPLPYLADSAELFEAIADEPWAVFLDSGRPHSTAGRMDILTARPHATLVTRGGMTEIRRSGSSPLGDASLSPADPFELLRRVLAADGRAPPLPFAGGAIGYFSYDLARRIERLPVRALDAEGIPEMAVGIYDWAVVVDHEAQRSWLVFQAIANSDLVVVRDVVMGLVAVVVVVNFLVDVLYAVVDPRLKASDA